MPKYLESLESRTFLSAAPVTLEAESAARSGAVVDNDIRGYTGTGYVDFQRSAGDWVEWTVNAAAAGTRQLGFRYVNGSSDRPLELRVNGQAVNSRMSFPNTGSWSTWRTATANVTLRAGANQIRLSTAGSNGPNVDSLTVSGGTTEEPPPPPPPTGILQAESATRYRVGVGRSHAGYTGTGYADFSNASGDWLEWNVNQSAAATRTLTFRYANGGGDRPLELRVNGQVLNPRMSFPPTGSWGTWKTITVNVPLRAGANQIRLTSIGYNGPNIDWMSVSGGSVEEPPPPPPPTGTFQAESAARYRVGVGTSHAGFTGTGYADYANASGDWVDWTVSAPTAGPRTLTFRYANGGGDRPLELRVNGQAVSARMSFPNTGSWGTWKTITATVPFVAGTNRVRLTSIGFNGPNVDSMSVSGPTAEPTPAERLRQAVNFAAQQLRRTAAEIPTSTYVNYTNSDGTWHVMDRIAWESGFLPASMWQMYKRTGDTYWRDQAAARTTPLEVSTDKPYDTSFIIYKPFKPLYDQTSDPQYRQVMLDAANAKAAHFHPTAGVFQGWDRASTSGDPRAQVGFYVDLMADLELFIWAAKETGNSDWLAMANRHAHKTADTLIRPDGSTIQWGYFDPATGDFVGPEQYQGYDVNSTWSRGQAWAIYGYALAYRELGDPRFLEMARKTADWYIAHLPADKVPYWDFNDPRIPGTYRDSSAAAIAASGLLDLAKQLANTEGAARYRSAAEATLLSLSSSAYLSEGTPDRSILRHAALNVPRNVGNNVGLIVGDYFFLEAIDRYFQ